MAAIRLAAGVRTMSDDTYHHLAARQSNPASARDVGVDQYGTFGRRNSATSPSIH